MLDRGGGEEGTDGLLDEGPGGGGIIDAGEGLRERCLKWRNEVEWEESVYGGGLGSIFGVLDDLGGESLAVALRSMATLGFGRRLVAIA